jgi:cell division initiation protein
MGLSPLDIHNKEFPKKALGGYNPDAVDEFLDQVIREFELLIKESVHLKEQVGDLQGKLEQYKDLEETINKTLIVAQETAEDMRTNAKKQGDLIIQEARLQAERIIETGQVKARRIIEENADLARAATTLRTQVKALLVAQLQAIEGLQDPFSRVAVGQMPSDTAAEAGDETRKW